MAGRSVSALPAQYHDRARNGPTEGVNAFQTGSTASSSMEDPHYVNTLTEDERDMIAEVLNRDAAMKNLEDKRLRAIRSEFQRLKDRSAQSLSTALDSSRGACGVCGASFSLFLNRGAACPKCQIRVCKSCQVASSTPKLRRSFSTAAFGGDSHDGWYCTLCDKRITIQKQTGEWIFLQAKNRAVRDSWRSQGPDLVRALLANAPGSSPLPGTPSLRDFKDGDVQWDSRRLLEESRHVLREEASAAVLPPSPPRPNSRGATPSRANSAAREAAGAVPQETLQQKVDRMEIPVEEDEEEGIGGEERGRGGGIAAPTAVVGVGGDTESVVRVERGDTMMAETISLAPTAFSIAATSEMSIHLKDDSGQSVSQEWDSAPTPEPLGDYIEIRTVTINKLPDTSLPGPVSRPSPIMEEPTPLPESTPEPTPEQELPPPMPEEENDDVSQSGIKEEQVVMETSQPYEYDKEPLRPPSVVSRSGPSTPKSRFGASMESLTSIYSEAGEGNFVIPVTGSMQFSVNYDYKLSRLEVKIMRCSNLAVANEKRQTSDPYVKAYLLPDKSRSGKKKTKIKKSMLNPVFNETLLFPLTLSELEHRTLNMIVCHSDRFGRNVFLGEVNLPGQVVGEYAVKQPKKPIDKDLQERSNETIASPLTYKGDLVLSVLFVSPERNVSKRGVPSGRGALAVHVKEARNLAGVKSNGYSDPFCKCYLLPDRTKAGKQKTDTIKKDCNPRWDHTFVFQDLSASDLKERAVELTIWDFDKLGSNDFLGGLRLSLGANASYGSPVDWMDSKGEEISMWQAMIDRPDTWIDGTLILRPHMNQRGVGSSPVKAPTSDLGRSTPVSGRATPAGKRAAEGRNTPRSNGRDTPRSIGRLTPNVS